MSVQVSENIERMPGRINTPARPVRLRELARAYVERTMTPLRAVCLALSMTALAAIADFITGADTAFTLFYVLPLAIAGRLAERVRPLLHDQGSGGGHGPRAVGLLRHRARPRRLTFGGHACGPRHHFPRVHPDLVGRSR